jgi:hypothetical protein
LKRRLAGELADARQDYQWAKNPFLEEMERRAEEWAIATDWSAEGPGHEDER